MKILFTFDFSLNCFTFILMISRRAFLKSSAALAALSVLPVGFSSCETVVSQKKIGMQLYSLMGLVNEDFDGTIAKLVEIGIRRFESFGYRNRQFFGKSPEEMKAFLESLGAAMTSSHTNMRFLSPGMDAAELWDGWKWNCSDTAKVGSGWIIQASYPDRQIQTLDDVLRLADQFNECGRIAKQFNLQFAFHNHHTELMPLDGEVPYEILLEHTDPKLVAFQMDTGYMQSAYGGAYLHLIHKYPGRFQSFHLRDVDENDEGVDLGQGVTDYDELFKLVEMAGMREYYIEQGGATLESMQRNYDFLMKATFVKW